MKEIYHVTFHQLGTHEFFKNLASIYAHYSKEELGVGVDWLYRWDFDKERYTNGIVYIEKAEVKSSKSAGKKILKAVNNS